MPKIAVLNNYPLESVWEEVKCKEKPDHHLYGINYFEQRGYEVKIIPFVNSQLLQNINKFICKSRFPLPLGDIDRQWSGLNCLNKVDLIYAPCQNQTYLLSYLRALSLIKKPIVCLAHHPINQGKLSWLRSPFIGLSVKGTDAFPSLSQQVAEAIDSLHSQPPKSGLLPWGPDVNFYPATSSLGEGVVAAGRTGRDFVTFGMAASQTNVQAEIICLENSVSEAFHSFAKNVRLTTQPQQGFMKYPELLKIYQNARVLAIPMLDDKNLCGLTSLMDALGMGKPVIMTKHPLIYLDIEKERIGKWVKAGDVEGWRQAIEFFDNNEYEALAMGNRAKELAKGGINSEYFANKVMDIFDQLLSVSSY